MRTLGLILILAGAALACNAPTSPPVTALPPGSLAATDPPMSTQPPVPTAAPPQQEPQPTPLSIAPLAPARLMERVNALAAIDTRHVNSVGARTAADQIAEGFASAGYTPERQTFPAVVNEQYTDQENVIARLPGQSDEIVVVGAHYDSRTVDPFDAAGRAPGAGDNASGAAALLEIARVLAGTTPRHTIVFVAFAGEEVGMLGSRYFVSQTDPAAIRAMFALDSIGGVAAPQDASRVFSPPPAGSESRWLAHRVALAAGPQPLGGLVAPTIDRPGRDSGDGPFGE
ncbi:MAG: Zn-dependent exopeptidase M28, partial [Chloroflexi bacterium]|nr:Zn-dependent exopeptidase M28 [Chloroflexota bacterium]